MCGATLAACLPLASLLAACSPLSSAGHPRRLLAAPNLHLRFAMATHLQLPRALLELDILVPQVRYFSTSKLYRKPWSGAPLLVAAARVPFADIWLSLVAALLADMPAPSA
jgi:hypothetical protein